MNEVATLADVIGGIGNEERAAKNVRVVMAVEEEANRILTSGRPFEYFIKTFKLDHEGDVTAARCISLVFASSSVASGDGLHCLLSGSSGRGKTHAAETMFKQLPDEYRYDRAFSDKYLYYAGNDPSSGLIPGAVILVDDQTMSEPLQEIFKVAVSRYSDPQGLKYGTVQHQKAITLKMPPRISWVLLKVDDPGDDQVMNRLIQARIQESDEKIRDSAKKIQEKYRDLVKRNIGSVGWEVRVCRSMWARIKSERVAVEVPCAGQVEFIDYENLRNHELFFNILMSHAIIHRWQREEIGRTEDDIPVIIATKDDYKEAVLIFEALYSFGGQRHNTMKNEDLVVDALLKMKPENGIFTIKEVAQVAGLSHKTTHRAINGREGRKTGELGGLLNRCPYIQRGGKRGRHELELHTENFDSQYHSRTEITRKESFNEDIYVVDQEGLRVWRAHGEIIKLVPGFKWERDST